MFKLVMLAGLLLLIMIVAKATRLMPHGTAAETVTPQQVYFRLHNDDELIAKPSPTFPPRRTGYRSRNTLIRLTKAIS